MLTTWYGMRQQTESRPWTARMADRDAPQPLPGRFCSRQESGIADYAGLFAVTAGIGAEKKDKEFEAALDDYSGIMFKALATAWPKPLPNACTSACAKDLWGYAEDENLSNEELIKEAYKGIRPAPGYPACPDHGQDPTCSRRCRPMRSA